MTMTFTIRTARPDDLERLASFAASAQADPERFCAYLGDDVESISADVAEIGSWTERTHVALDDAREVVGWLLADVDEDMGRVWWWGPFLAGTSADDDLVADALMTTGLHAMADYGEHELAPDGRSAFIAALAGRHGFTPNEGSVLLRCDFDAVDADAEDGEIAPVDPAASADIADLHDRLFAGTHTPGAVLVANGDDRHHRWALRRDGVLIGYVATELQHDGSMYLDFLGVEPDARRAGAGRRLVRHALRHGKSAGASYAHLTMRVGNDAARALYASIGFVEERILVPYRRGFELN